MENHSEDESIYFILLSHHLRENLNRTWKLNFREKQYFICSRCTGVASGLVTALLLRQTIVFFSQNSMLLLALPAFAMADWVLQTLKVHESKNPIRIASGFFLGLCWASMLYLLLTDWSNIMLWITAVLYVAVFIVVLPIRLKQEEKNFERIR